MAQLTPDQVKQLHVVPEEIVVEAADFITKQGGKPNNWRKLLKAAQIFRHAKMTPIFLANHDGSAWCVSSEETFNRHKKLH